MSTITGLMTGGGGSASEAIDRLLKDKYNIEFEYISELKANHQFNEGVGRIN